MTKPLLYILINAHLLLWLKGKHQIAHQRAGKKVGDQPVATGVGGAVVLSQASKAANRPTTAWLTPLEIFKDAWRFSKSDRKRYLKTNHDDFPGDFLCLTETHKFFHLSEWVKTSTCRWLSQESMNTVWTDLLFPRSWTENQRFLTYSVTRGKVCCMLERRWDIFSLFGGATD